MKYIMRIFTLLSLVILLNGFATVTDSISAKAAGHYCLYEKPYDTVWNAVLDVVKTSKLQLITENKGSGQIIALESHSLCCGKDVVIFVEEQSSTAKTRVEVISENAVARFEVSQNWEKYLLQKFDDKLR